MNSKRTRSLASLALLAVSGVLLLVGGLALYSSEEIADNQAFAQRASVALENDAVRRLVADEIVTQLIEYGSPNLLSIRPLLNSVVAGLLDTEQFAQLFEGAVRDAHALFLGRGQGGLVIDLADAGTLVSEGLRSISPSLANEVPPDIRPTVADLRESNLAVRSLRAADRVRRIGWILPLLALVGFLAAIAIAPSRRAALTGVGAAIASVSAAVIAGLLVWRGVVVEGVEESGLVARGDVAEAVDAVWEAYLGDLLTWSVTAGAIGLAVAIVSSGKLEPARDGARIEALLRPLLRPATRLARVGRAVVLLLAGSLLLVHPAAAVRGLAALAGAIFLLLGLEDAAGVLEHPRRVRAARAVRRRSVVAGSAGAVLAAVVALLAAGIISFEGDRPVDSPDRVEASNGCNGFDHLCDRRLGEVVFAGTHNSFAASARPGWLFANQRVGLAQQLRDGVRAILLDAHYGVRNRDGRVRTDLGAEGVSRNSIARQLSPAALRAADRLAGRVGIGKSAGPTGLFACHGLCELGATPFVAELETIRRFLVGNPREVVILFVEPYASPSDVARAFRGAQLMPYVATLEVGEQLPRMSEFVESGRRLVVFDERPGSFSVPSENWYHPAGEFVQDTPLGAQKTADFSCRRARGEESAPLLLVNHWIDRFPPRVSAARRVNQRSVLQRRVNRCEAQRGQTPNIFAVDFYRLGDLLKVVRDMNSEAG